MNWLYLTILMLILFGVGIMLAVKTDMDVLPTAAIVVGLLEATISIAMFACGAISTPRKINLFVQQKEYIESHIATDAIEDAALTSKKIELNEWLYSAQYSAQHFGGWSFYPDDILELEPIQ